MCLFSIYDLQNIAESPANIHIFFFFILIKQFIC